MPGQVNARLTPEHDAEFDRWATELGVERGTLARDIIKEALAARREGRATFEQPEMLGPGDLIAMKAGLDRGVMEIDRIATSWAAHESETREGARKLGAYVEGRVVEFRTDLRSQGFGRGDCGTVVGQGTDRVRLRMASGKEREFVPGKLPRNLRHDAVSVYAVKSLELHAGDRIRWTDNDRDRGLANADLARVEEVGRGGVTVSSLADGTMHELKSGDRMLERLDLAYAINVHVAQGVTAKHGIVAMASDERGLNNAKGFLVAMTRIADKATLVVDSGQKLERAVTRNPGEKTSALDMASKAGPSAVRTVHDLSVFSKEDRAMMHVPWPEKSIELGL